MSATNRPFDPYLARFVAHAEDHLDADGLADDSLEWRMLSASLTFSRAWSRIPRVRKPTDPDTLARAEAGRARMEERLAERARLRILSQCPVAAPVAASWSETMSENPTAQIGPECEIKLSAAPRTNSVGERPMPSMGSVRNARSS